MDEIKFELPQLDVNIDFSKAKKTIDENSRILNFLQEKDLGIVQIDIDDIKYELKTIGASPSNKILHNYWEKSKTEQQNVLFWYRQCLENKIRPSQAGVLSHFLKKVTAEMKQKTKNTQLTDKEIENIFSNGIKLFSDPTMVRMEELEEKRMIINVQQQSLIKEKEEIEQRAEKRINIYIKLIFLASVAQLLSFYYMIFHVEWLGWDIVEPITYSVQQLTVLLGIRFFIKYRQVRTLKNMQELWKMNQISKNRLVKERYDSLISQIQNLEDQKKLYNAKIDIYKNRKDYSHYIW